MFRIKIFLVSLMILFFSVVIFSQDNQFEDEINTDIPALAEFHEVIYSIWHTYYPSKDITGLKNSMKEVNEKAQKIYEVKLPGILREKEENWKKGIQEFKNAVDGYNQASSANDEQAMLDAAEILHSKYENLVRIVKPVVKELEEFHKVLYIIYHKYLPDKKWTQIRNECDSLKEKSKKVYEAKLPKSIESKTNEYKNLANDLIQSVDKLCVAKDKEMANAVETMHTKYEKLLDLFE